MLVHLTVEDFIQELASDSPAPGGGSVSALAGSLGAALVSMVANLTVGKESFKESEAEMRGVLAKAAELKERLGRMVDEDTAAFHQVMAAYKLPKGSEEEKARRSEAIQAALKQAALLPLEVARHCLAVMELSKTVVNLGNPNALSDAAVSMLMAYAGLQGAVYNAEINLAGIKEQAFKNDMAAEKARLMEGGKRLAEEVRSIVEQKLL
ncbi:MAG: cyclodeaminase/cyclohydrolase family protein [Bacillota bacterium]